MSIPARVLESLKAIFARTGKQLKNVEFVGDSLARQTIHIATIGVPGAIIGYAVGHDGKRHPIAKDSNGDHHLVDTVGNSHKLG